MAEDFEHIEPFEIEELGDNDFTNGVWSERVLVITQDYEKEAVCSLISLTAKSDLLLSKTVKYPTDLCQTAEQSFMILYN